MDKKDAFRLMEEHGMPENIRRHSIVVNRVANWLAEKLEKSGVKIDRKTVDLASLLHDIDKIYEIKGTGKHGQVSYEILSRMDIRVATAVRKHLLSTIAREGLDTWEEKVVYYADKRVTNDRVVTLEDRYKYLYEKYGTNRAAIESIRRTEKPAFELEKEIFRKTGSRPGDLLKLNPESS